MKIVSYYRVGIKYHCLKSVSNQSIKLYCKDCCHFISHIKHHLWNKEQDKTKKSKK